MKIVFFLILIISILKGFCGLGDGGHYWSYSDQASWPPLCQQGKKQSPIALSKETATHKSFPPFLFKDYVQTTQVQLENNGHTLEMRLKESIIAYHAFPKMTGGGLKHLYRLHHFHFHWDSEHTIEQKRYPLELHMVHYVEKAPNLTIALEKPQNVAVLAVLFEISTKDNIYIQPIVESISQIKVGEIKKAEVKAYKLIPKDKNNFYRYYGSLTTPGCIEGVLWTVFKKPLKISRRQANMFESLQTVKNKLLKLNYRDIQPINNRIVLMGTVKRKRNQVIGNATKKIIEINFCLLILIFFLFLLS